MDVTHDPKDQHGTLTCLLKPGTKTDRFVMVPPRLRAENMTSRYYVRSSKRTAMQAELPRSCPTGNVSPATGRTSMTARNATLDGTAAPSRRRPAWNARRAPFLTQPDSRHALSALVCGSFCNLSLGLTVFSCCSWSILFARSDSMRCMRARNLPERDGTIVM